MIDICTIEDVIDCGPFEGETLYNKAYKYGRHDICLLIAETKRKTADFEENVRKYEETGEQQYKDKATGRYYHKIMWEEIICRLRDGDTTKPYQHSCITKCEMCPISKRAGICSDENSAYYKFTTALDRGDIETAIKYAEVIADAWTR